MRYRCVTERRAGRGTGTNSRGHRVRSIPPHRTQEVCPWNVRFASELKEPVFAAREMVAGKDARELARQLAEDLLAMSKEEFSAAFRKSPM